MTVLYVMSFPGGNQTFLRHLPWFQKARIPIIGVGTNDGKCEFGNVPFIYIGKNTYADGDHHPVRFIGVLQHFLSTKYHRAVVVEYDAIFLKPIPDFGPPYVAGTIAGHKSPGFLADNFYATPWITNQITAAIIVKAGLAMLKVGLNEKGFLDRWLGLLFQLYDLPVANAAGFSYCRNSIDRPEYVQEAREAIQSGNCCYIHGIKTAEQLRQVTEGLV